MAGPPSRCPGDSAAPPWNPVSSGLVVGTREGRFQLSLEGRIRDESRKGPARSVRTGPLVRWLSLLGGRGFALAEALAGDEGRRSRAEQEDHRRGRRAAGP